MPFRDDLEAANARADAAEAEVKRKESKQGSSAVAEKRTKAANQAFLWFSVFLVLVGSILGVTVSSCLSCMSRGGLPQVRRLELGASLSSSKDFGDFYAVCVNRHLAAGVTVVMDGQKGPGTFVRLDYLPPGKGTWSRPHASTSGDPVQVKLLPGCNVLRVSPLGLYKCTGCAGSMNERDYTIKVRERQ